MNSLAIVLTVAPWILAVWLGASYLRMRSQYIRDIERNLGELTTFRGIVRDLKVRHPELEIPRFSEMLFGKAVSRAGQIQMDTPSTGRPA